MPRLCSACNHLRLTEINEDLVRKIDSYRAIASKYGITESSLKRHAATHLPLKLTAAAHAAEVVEATSLLDQVQRLHAEAASILDQAKRTGTAAWRCSRSRRPARCSRCSRG